MSRAVSVMLLASLVLLGLGARRSSPAGLAPGIPLLEAGSAEAEQDAWRLRLFALALVGGRAARHDRYLDAPQGRAVPWPPLFPAVLAAAARQFGFRGRDAVELGALQDLELLEFSARFLPLLGACAVVGAYLAARSLQGGPCADLAGLCAAALWALLPPVVFAERAGRIDPHALTALISMGLVGATSFALRAREEVDATLGGLAAGVLTGLGLACGVDALVVILACTLAFGVCAWRARPGARRALLLLLVAGAVTTSMGVGHETAWAEILPIRVTWGARGGSQALRHWSVVGVGSAALVALVAGWRVRARFATLVLLLAGMGWAAMFDPGAPAVALAVVLAAAVATADLTERLRPGWRALAPLGLALVVLPALGFRPPDPLRPAAEEVGDLRAWREALGWMRDQDPAEGPWNQPAARPAGWILTAPSFAASVAVGARWPVVCAAPPGLRASAGRAARAAQLLAGPADAAQVEALREAGVWRVVVGPGMATDPWLAQALQGAQDRTLFTALATSSAVPAGLERLWPRSAGGAPLSVWRVSAAGAPPTPANMRPR